MELLESNDVGDGLANFLGQSDRGTGIGNRRERAEEGAEAVCAVVVGKALTLCIGNLCPVVAPRRGKMERTDRG